MRCLLTLLAALVLAGCKSAPHPAAWTHPTALYHDRDCSIVGAPTQRGRGNTGLPWVEVYVSTHVGAMNKARVWGFTEAEAMRDAALVARALGG